MPKISAGLLMFRRRPGGMEVLLVHPGGPFFRNKDAGAWSIPKGEVEPGEDVPTAARREFEEELGVRIDSAQPLLELSPVKIKSGKIIHARAIEGDVDTRAVTSNTFTMEWPPRSGRQITFPEIDRAEFFPLAEARRRINPGQMPLIDELEGLLGLYP